MKIYLDVCCLNRPFDDQYQDRIRIEAEAIMSILFRCQEGQWQLISSDIIDVEINKMKNPDKKRKVMLLSSIASKRIKFNENIEERALEFHKLGIGLFDSLHISLAEEAGADVFLTTDDKLIKRAKQLDIIKIPIENPVKWLMEVTENEEYN